MTNSKYGTEGSLSGGGGGARHAKNNENRKKNLKNVHKRKK